MGNGIIFVVIVGLWAVVLVPQWLRKHDAAAESKSVERYSTAMRSLSRRGTGPRSAGSRDMLVPGAARGPVLSGGRAPSASARRAHAAKQARMRRRRTISLGLIGFLAVMVAAAALGTAPLWLPLVVLVVTGGYVWNLRAQAAREARMERIRRRRASAAPAARPTSRPATRALPQAPVWPAAATRTAAPIVADTVIVAEQLDGAWAPTPIVLPTYATAPPATAIPRVIDLTHPGSWSAAHMLDHAAAAGATPDPDEIFDGRALLEEAGSEYYDGEAIIAEQAALAQTVAGASGRSFLDDDAVFDQYDEDEQFLALLERRAVND